MPPKHDPKKSTALIVRFLRSDPARSEAVKSVSGRAEAIKWLKKLSTEDPESDRYAYLWRWEDPQAALQYDLEHM